MERKKSISLAELNQLLKSNNGVTVIDVRSAEEYKDKHIPFATHLPIEKIESKDVNLDWGKTIITVCGNGAGRSDRAANFLRENYNVEAVFLEGGTFGWVKNEDSIIVKNKTIIQRLVQKGYLPNDSIEEKLKKSTLLIMAIPFALAGIIWGALYFINGLILPGFIPFSYGILSLISVTIFLANKKFRIFRFSQILLILLLPFFLQITLGGFIPSSAVIIWGLISPLGALAFYHVKQSIYWFMAFIALVVGAFFLNDSLPEYFNWNLSEKFIHLLFLMNIVGVSGIIFLMQYYFGGKQTEMKKSLEEKNEEIQEKNKEITDSISYAKRIQHALLANGDLLKKNLTDHFILFKPKDIVSGDFYWATSKNDKFYLAACDSTGHGVPGAFMSLLNISFLNEAINERNISAPNEICGHVRNKLIESISQDGGQDGMDGVLVCIDKEKKKLSFTAAHNAPILIRKNTVIEFEADKMPIGKGDKTENFKQHVIDIMEGDTFYLYTDGYTDQFGGGKGKKFKYKQMKALLQSICNQPLNEQRKILDEIICNWKGDMEQTDDILIIGFKF